MQYHHCNPLFHSQTSVSCRIGEGHGAGSVRRAFFAQNPVIRALRAAQSYVLRALLHTMTMYHTVSQFAWYYVSSAIMHANHSYATKANIDCI